MDLKQQQMANGSSEHHEVLPQSHCRQDLLDLLEGSGTLGDFTNHGHPVTNVALETGLFDLRDEHEMNEHGDHSTASCARAKKKVSSLCTEASMSAMGTDIIGKRLLKYGIVPMERKPVHVDKATENVKHAVEEVHRWLFVEGGHYRSVQALMTNYCLFVRNNLGIPVDRLVYGGLGLHPKLTALIWKWEPNDFAFHEIPEEIFERRNEVFSPHEPFCVLERGTADFVRIKSSDTFIPPDTEKWFRAEHYVDYLALPDIHRNESKGSLAWATKDPRGFTDDDISFFEITLPALTTVLRLHTNDLVLRTMTERMEREIQERTRELEEANRQLAAANSQLAFQSQRQLQHFACMSHEIRTPLNCIVGMASLLLENPESLLPEVADSVQMIHSSAELLHAVVDDVLDYSKLESGIFDVDIQPTNLQETLSGVVHVMQEKAAQKSIDIVPTFGPTLPQVVNTDPRRLQQIMYNLLGNACKFSNVGGKVELNVSLTELHDVATSNKDQPQEGQLLRLAVKDYGKGILEKDLEAIFQPFHQGSTKTQTMYGGTGLGLSITRALIGRLGGRISVESKVEEFAEFVVEIPLSGIKIGVSDMRDALMDTRIVILGHNNEHTSTSGPFGHDTIQAFGLDVFHVDNWDKFMESFHSQKGWQDKSLIIVVPVEQHNPIVFQDIRGNCKDCRLITHGRASAPHDACLHWQSLATTFPSVAMEQILNQKQVSTNSSKSTVSVDGTLDSSSSTCGSLERAGISDQIPFVESTRILIAEDNVINQKVLARILKNLGVRSIDVVDNGEKAVKACSETFYSLVFMDLQMPVMDGLQATQVIRSDGEHCQTKIVFCTAHALEDFRRQVHDVGADGFISKPFNMKSILQCLQEHLL